MHWPKASGTALVGDTVMVPMVLSLDNSDWMRLTSPEKALGCDIAIVSRMMEWASPRVAERDGPTERSPLAAVNKTKWKLENRIYQL